MESVRSACSKNLKLALKVWSLYSKKKLYRFMIYNFIEDKNIILPALRGKPIVNIHCRTSDSCFAKNRNGSPTEIESGEISLRTYISVSRLPQTFRLKCSSFSYLSLPFSPFSCLHHPLSMRSIAHLVHAVGAQEPASPKSKPS